MNPGKPRALLAVYATAGLLGLSSPAAAQAVGAAPAVQQIRIANGMALHYVELGKGQPVVFVHGSLSDGSYWNPQLAEFAKKYHVIAYSRRYNQPNTNAAQAGYSAVTDADDLAGLIVAKHLGPVHVIGHSYGALTGLFLAARHPEMVRSLVLAEAPAVSLLMHLPGTQAENGRAIYAEIQREMVAPMKAAFQKGDRETGVKTFINYVFGNPEAWDSWSEEDRRETLRNAHEWDIMMTDGEVFPVLEPAAVRRIEAPTLLLSGANSYAFLRPIDEELERLLPNRTRIILKGATHRMWYEQPQNCRSLVLNFLAGK